MYAYHFGGFGVDGGRSNNQINPGTPISSGDWFGFNSSADANWLAVGVPFGTATDQGQVQLFRLDTGTGQWIFHSTINGGAAGSRFGIRVLLRGDRLLVGATEEAGGGGSSTRGWVYE